MIPWLITAVALAWAIVSHLAMRRDRGAHRLWKRERYLEWLDSMPRAPVAHDPYVPRGAVYYINPETHRQPNGPA